MFTSFVIFIGPWTFLYGALFSLAALGLDRVTRWLGVIVLVGGLAILKDIPGTFAAVSFYVLLSRGRA